MFVSTTKVRVRYSETDMMGYCYYGNYAAFFEVARVEAIRGLGFSYRQMEEEGIALPVLEYHIKYYKPAFYDDELTIETTITEIPKARIHFRYKTFNEKGTLLNEASTSLVFISKETMKPCSAPQEIVEAMQKYF
ncbi:MAG: acyl-CoA thioesterase [Flavobacteriales bacterium]|nr:acyl-CoA thioesterase [Flavobacteriales bacterium]